ncbi:VWA domain-containing protein [Baaleninema sp.]|uniref:VWA domain-containing protein n=1 Tax=Baaleninema sp. TaxID=3101197 RepID=UPI003CFCD62F
MISTSDSQDRRRWRLVLGSEAEEGTTDDGILDPRDKALDRALSALYDSDRRGGLGSSSPNIARWLGDIRSYFPNSVVKILQQDAIERLDLRQMLLEPELLNQVEPDVRLVGDLLALKDAMPVETRETARQVVRQVVEDLNRRLAVTTRQAVVGSLDRARRNRRPRYREINWDRTIRANLKHYRPEYGTIIPETLVGYGRKRSSLQDIVLCLDQSGSMATSLVYASVFGAVLASLSAVNVRFVAFDTSVVDLTADLGDPVDLLFGLQLGGGTDIQQALAYCQSQIHRPLDTILVLISDLFEGGNVEALFDRIENLVRSGVRMVTLLALNDDGAPDFSHGNAERLTALGVPCFACTPDWFPELMAAAIQGRDLTQWAGKYLA